MHHARRRRLFFILMLLISLSVALSLALYALRQNISLYDTPQQVISQKIPFSQGIRIGGIVAPHSVFEKQNSLNVRFKLTDGHTFIWVNYNGILPSLFREGQSIVVEGKRTSMHEFMADQVLAKHDEKYHPPGIT